MSSPLAEPGTASQNDEQRRAVLEESLVRAWESILDVSTIGLHSDFFQVGGRPDDGAKLVEWIRQDYGVAIRVSDLYEARTVAKLADLIQIKQSAREQLCLVPIRATGSREPLFLVHGVGGNILGFAGLARSLEAEQPVYGIQAQALNPDGPTLIRLEAMARYYIEELRRVQPTGPYAFLGFSFGGLVAYEMARQLAAAGESIRFLGMLDTWQPQHLKLARNVDEPWMRHRWKRLHLVRLNTKKLTVPQLAFYLAGRLRGRFLRAAVGRISHSEAISLPESMRQVRDINLTAASRYVIRPYPGRITLFRAHEDPNLKLPEDLNWNAYAEAGVEIVHLPGDHGQILAEPNLSFMTARLNERLSGVPACADAVPLVETNAQEFEEFELGDDGLIDLSASLSPEPTASSNHLVAAWKLEARTMGLDAVAGFGTPREATE